MMKERKKARLFLKTLVLSPFDKYNVTQMFIDCVRSGWGKKNMDLSHDAGIVLCLVCRSLPWAKYFPLCLPTQSSSTNYNHSVWLQWLPIPFFLNLICRGEKRKDWWAFERDWRTSGDTGWRERRTQSISEMGQRKKVNSTQL